MHEYSSTAAPANEAAAQLRDLERQGGGMARLAHICAALLLAAFSLGSLISISAIPFYRFLANWNAATFDMPDAISIAVNVLLVLAADVALLYAASVLRVQVTSGAPMFEQRIHRWAIIGACVLESSTYLYLVWSFDRPSSVFLWAIGIGRALAAPGCAAYLSMARPLPVGPRDVAYNAALAAGKGVVRDVTVLAGDPTASLERKVRIYSASAQMSPQDAARFRNIIDAVSEDDVTQDTPRLSAPEGPEPEPPVPPRGRPDSSPEPADEDTQAGQTPYVAALQLMPSSNRTVRRARGSIPRETTRLDDLRVQAFALLDANPALSDVKLRAKLGCNRAIARDLHAEWRTGRRRLSLVAAE